MGPSKSNAERLQGRFTDAVGASWTSRQSRAMRRALGLPRRHLQRVTDITKLDVYIIAGNLLGAFSSGNGSFGPMSPLRSGRPSRSRVERHPHD